MALSSEHLGGARRTETVATYASASHQASASGLKQKPSGMQLLLKIWIPKLTDRVQHPLFKVVQWDAAGKNFRE
jgi:hypothetical protein